MYHCSVSWSWSVEGFSAWCDFNYLVFGVLISRDIKGILLTYMGSSWWRNAAGENLHVTSPCDLGFLQHDGWVPRGWILRTTILRKPARNYKTSYDLAAAVTQCHFYHILLIESKWQGQPKFKVRRLHRGLNTRNHGSLGTRLWKPST